jgi:hypothetical protein
MASAVRARMKASDSASFWARCVSITRRLASVSAETAPRVFCAMAWAWARASASAFSWAAAAASDSARRRCASSRSRERRAERSWRTAATRGSTTRDIRTYKVPKARANHRSWPAKLSLWKGGKFGPCSPGGVAPVVSWDGVAIAGL